jgi:hypothetical protein
LDEVDEEEGVHGVKGGCGEGEGLNHMSALAFICDI